MLKSQGSHDHAATGEDVDVEAEPAPQTTVPKPRNELSSMYQAKLQHALQGAMSSGRSGCCTAPKLFELVLHVWFYPARLRASSSSCQLLCMHQRLAPHLVQVVVHALMPCTALLCPSGFVLWPKPGPSMQGYIITLGPSPWLGPPIDGFISFAATLKGILKGTLFQLCSSPGTSPGTAQTPKPHGFRRFTWLGADWLRAHVRPSCINLPGTGTPSGVLLPCSCPLPPAPAFAPSRSLESRQDAAGHRRHDSSGIPIS